MSGGNPFLDPASPSAISAFVNLKFLTHRPEENNPKLTFLNQWEANSFYDTDWERISFHDTDLTIPAQQVHQIDFCFESVSEKPNRTRRRASSLPTIQELTPYIADDCLLESDKIFIARNKLIRSSSLLPSMMNLSIDQNDMKNNQYLEVDLDRSPLTLPATDKQNHIVGNSCGPPHSPLLSKRKNKRKVDLGISKNTYGQFEIAKSKHQEVIDDNAEG